MSRPRILSVVRIHLAKEVLLLVALEADLKVSKINLDRAAVSKVATRIPSETYLTSSSKCSATKEEEEAHLSNK